MPRIPYADAAKHLTECYRNSLEDDVGMGEAELRVQLGAGDGELEVTYDDETDEFIVTEELYKEWVAQVAS